MTVIERDMMNAIINGMNNTDDICKLLARIARALEEQNELLAQQMKSDEDDETEPALKTDIF